MTLKAKQQPTELEHIRDTLTDVVVVLGETRQDVKRLEKKVGSNHQEVCSRLDRQDADISEMKETLKLILSKLPSS